MGRYITSEIKGKNMNLDQNLHMAGIYDLLKDVRNVDDIGISSIEQISEIITSLQPVLSMRLVGPGYNQTVSYGMSTALVDLQKIIYKMYSVAVYGTPNTNRLSNSDKERLEIFFKVDAGSSKIEANLSDAIVSFAKEAVKKMSGNQVFLAVIFIAICLTGNSLYKAHIDDKERERKSNFDSRQQELIYDLSEKNKQSQESILETIKTLSFQNERTEDIYVLGSEIVPEIILKATTSTEYTEFNGYHLTGERAKFLSKKPNDNYQKFNDKWDVIIIGVNTKLDDEDSEEGITFWKINIFSPSHDRNYTVSLTSPALLSKEKKSLLWTSLDKGSTVKIAVSGKRSNDGLVYKDLTLRDIE